MSTYDLQLIGFMVGIAIAFVLAGFTSFVVSNAIKKVTARALLLMDKIDDDVDSAAASMIHVCSVLETKTKGEPDEL